jgi:hypothetical protein
MGNAVAVSSGGNQTMVAVGVPKGPSGVDVTVSWLKVDVVSVGAAQAASMHIPTSRKRIRGGIFIVPILALKSLPAKRRGVCGMVISYRF